VKFILVGFVLFFSVAQLGLSEPPEAGTEMPLSPAPSGSSDSIPSQEIPRGGKKILRKRVKKRLKKSQISPPVEIDGSEEDAPPAPAVY